MCIFLDGFASFFVILKRHSLNNIIESIPRKVISIEFWFFWWLQLCLSSFGSLLNYFLNRSLRLQIVSMLLSLIFSFSELGEVEIVALLLQLGIFVGLLVTHFNSLHLLVCLTHGLPRPIPHLIKGMKVNFVGIKYWLLNDFQHFALLPENLIMKL